MLQASILANRPHAMPSSNKRRSLLVLFLSLAGASLGTAQAALDEPAVDAAAKAVMPQVLAPAALRSS